MNNKYTKDLVLLGALIIGCSIAARFMARGETLNEYDRNREASAQSSTTESSVEISDSSSSIYSSAEASASDKVTDKVTYMDGFSYESLPQNIIDKIYGVSFVDNDNVSIEDLSYCRLLYNDFDGNTQAGELICNKSIAQDIVEIFYELYTSGYQIESIKLIDEYNGDDTASMLANNTSCFNYRVVEGTKKLSKHAYGLAIDLNPFYNPYITYNKDGSQNISPAGSESYADRNSSFPYKIDENDLAYKLFTEHGFKWGGNWNSVKDYQHFEYVK